ncbi:hypothetical protein [Comamonas thiooxydans]|uniref:hypothetical protein n=1 Tax=Comamonas thiooxydans TaxID=363952 RepID=UPI000A717F46|nr:hypothetical protein [Comamonas thiooxydans]
MQMLISRVWSEVWNPGAGGLMEEQGDPLSRGSFRNKKPHGSHAVFDNGLVSRR